MSVERLTVQTAVRQLHWPGYRLYCSPPLDWVLSSTLSVRLALTQQTDRHKVPNKLPAKKKSVVMKYCHVNTSCCDVKCCAFLIISAVLLRFVSVGMSNCRHNLTLKMKAELSFETSDSTAQYSSHKAAPHTPQVLPTLP